MVLKRMVLRADECLPLQDTSIVSVVYAGRTVVANTPKSYVLQCLSTGRTTWGYPIPHLTHGSLGPDESTAQTVSRSVQTFLFGSRSLSTDTQTFRLAWCRELSVVMATELLPPWDLACGTLFQSSCAIQTSPMDCADDS